TFQNRVAESLGFVESGGEDGLPPLAIHREFPCKSGKVDFAVESGDVLIAIEVKTRGTLAATERQLTRYLKDDRFTAGMIVTTRAWAPPVREGYELNGKPVQLVRVWKAGL